MKFNTVLVLKRELQLVKQRKTIQRQLGQNKLNEEILEVKAVRMGNWTTALRDEKRNQPIEAP